MKKDSKKAKQSVPIPVIFDIKSDHRSFLVGDKRYLIREVLVHLLPYYNKTRSEVIYESTYKDLISKKDLDKKIHDNLVLKKEEDVNRNRRIKRKIKNDIHKDRNYQRCEKTNLSKNMIKKMLLGHSMNSILQMRDEKIYNLENDLDPDIYEDLKLDLNKLKTITAKDIDKVREVVKGFIMNENFEKIKEFIFADIFYLIDFADNRLKLQKDYEKEQLKGTALGKVI